MRRTFWPGIVYVQRYFEMNNAIHLNDYKIFIVHTVDTEMQELITESSKTHENSKNLAVGETGAQTT